MSAWLDIFVDVVVVVVVDAVLVPVKEVAGIVVIKVNVNCWVAVANVDVDEDDVGCCSCVCGWVLPFSICRLLFRFIVLEAFMCEFTLESFNFKIIISFNLYFLDGVRLFLFLPNLR